MRIKSFLAPILILFFTIISTNAVSAGTIRKGPYLFYPNNPTEMTVLWQLDVTESCTLEWGTTPSVTDGTVNTTEYGTDHQHKHVIPNLISNTKYYYSVTVGTVKHTGSFFSAPPATDTHLKFLAYGDTRSNPSKHNIIANEIIKSYTADSGYNTFILLAGDYIGTGSSESGWQNEFFPRNQPNILQMQSEIPIQGAIGNHEKSSMVFKKYWPYPYETADRFYWTFEYGPAQFFMVDQYTSYSTGSTQYTWLENALKNSTKEWKFMMFHEPGWSAGGGHSNEKNVQTYLHPLCKTYGVDILFAGDNHYYARADVEGIHHVTTGGGGAPLYSPNSNAQHIVATKKDLNFCEIDIQGKKLSFTARDSNGVVIDSFSVQHASPPAVVADYTYMVTDLTVDFTDQSTATSTTITGWNWDFGDGTTSTQQHPTHTFTTSGTYAVSLTVTDGTLSDTQKQSVVVTNPPVVTAGFTVSTNELTANFSDTSTASNTTITGWSWDFGDTNTSTVQNPSHTYAAAGTYTVKLTVTDGTISDTKTDTVVVKETPVPAVTAGFTFSTNALTASFTDTSTASNTTITGWSWDFGDNNTSTVQNPSHSYASAGTYTVKLTVTDGTISDTKTDTVVVKEVPVPALTANFTFTTSTLTANFTDTSTASNTTITSWSWNFGDNTTSTVQSPSHTYTSAGTYTVKLTVTDGTISDTKTDTVVVTEPVSYCSSSAQDQSYEWMARVVVGDLDKSSNASPYSDFTASTANLTPGSTVSVSLTPGFAGSPYSEYWRIWIDYNQNGKLDDASEKVFEKSGSGTVTGTFQVPQSVTGTTRMRISVQYNKYPTSCGSFQYGEVEDYTVSF